MLLEINFQENIFIKLYGYTFEIIFTAYGHYFYQPMQTTNISIGGLV